MATMHHLFFGVLFIAVCAFVGANNDILTSGYAVSPSIKVSGKRNDILQIASAEIGVWEATGNNDGKRVEEYLRYTNLGKGYAWCAAFVSWCYGQAGLPEPRNPWSPALFPNARTYCRGNARRRPVTLPQINPADVFGIYGASVRRINHVGFVKDVQGKYLITIEGNSNNRVESKRRHLATIYALADWVGGKP